MRCKFKRTLLISCFLAVVVAIYLTKGSRGSLDNLAKLIKVLDEKVNRGKSLPSKKRPNVLFLIADDMRAEIGVYNDPVTRAAFYPKIHTPNLDVLAKTSLLLHRAYVQQALCSPSRTSFLTGRRPDTTRVYDIGTYWRYSGGNFTTLPQYFKEQGYYTFSSGKVFHAGHSSGRNDRISWSGTYRPDKSNWMKERNKVWSAADEKKLKTFPLEDMQSTSRTIKALQWLAPAAKTGQQPFFIAVGFHKPHLPLLCPGKFFDLYPESEIELPKNPYAPVDMPGFAWSDYSGVRMYSLVKELGLTGCINTTLPDKLAKDIRRAYYSCVSYVDSLVGEIMETLQALELADDTIVSFLGDHGYQLGEHALWEKQTNFELTNHAPLMVRVPGLTDKGLTTQALVEFVDIFPTIAEAAGLPPVPQCPVDSRSVNLCTEGLSFVPLMKDPTQAWKTAAFSQYPRMTNQGEIVMGYSMKTDHHRYTEWTKVGIYELQGHIQPTILTRELYDHVQDPDENWNRANEKNHAKVVQSLQEKLSKGWREALPTSIT